MSRNRVVTSIDTTSTVFWRRFSLLLLLLLLIRWLSPFCWGGDGGWPTTTVVQGLVQQQPQQQQRPLSQRPFALMTGATGRTGQIVARLLLEQRGFAGLRVLARNTSQARELLAPIVAAAVQSANNNSATPIVEYCPCDLGDAAAVEAAFALNSNNNSINITHVVFCAGGDGADYRAVNYRGLAQCARIAASSTSIRQVVVISTAWATRPYSAAALLFNALFSDSTPMAVHYLGERELRRAACGNGGFDYVILRPGALKNEPSVQFPDAVEKSYAKLFPDYDASSDGLTYRQGDSFQFLGPPGRFGMTRTQLAHAVLSAINVEGRYTVEVTNCGATALDDASVYQSLLRQDEPCDDMEDTEHGRHNDDILRIHRRAVAELKVTALTTSLAGIVSISLLGWFDGIVSFLALDAMLVFSWRKFLADRQAI